jgi:hypothetical protein
MEPFWLPFVATPREWPPLLATPVSDVRWLSEHRADYSILVEFRAYGADMWTELGRLVYLVELEVLW